MAQEVDESQRIFSGTSVPEGSDVLDEVRLSAWMSVNVPGFRGPLQQAKFAGGQSNPTYRLTTPTGAYVLRRKPFGELLPSAHAVDREFRVLSGLHKAGFPVPAPLGLCTDPAVIGSWFYVMEMVSGRTIWNGSLPDAASAKERREIYFSMIDTIAALQAIDVDQAGLGDFGKPGNYFQRQVDRWTRQYRLAETEPVKEMDLLIDYLSATVPQQTGACIVHGDFRIDNLIFAPTEPRVLAVLDWELSTLGDPMADFTYFVMAWTMENDGRAGVLDLDRRALGIPELEEIVERYCAASGRSAVPDLNWYFAFNFFRMTGIGQGIKKRILDGTASSAHARKVAEKVGETARRGWNHARLAGAT